MYRILWPFWVYKQYLPYTDKDIHITNILAVLICHILFFTFSIYLPPIKEFLKSFCATRKKSFPTSSVIWDAWFHFSTWIWNAFAPSSYIATTATGLKCVTANKCCVFVCHTQNDLGRHTQHWQGRVDDEKTVFHQDRLYVENKLRPFASAKGPVCLPLAQ